MQSKLIDWEYKTLYEFLSDKIAKNIFSQSQYLLNLESKEYSQCISRYVPEDKKLITCTFSQIISGKVVEKGTLAKMARDEMIRFMAENNIEDLNGVKELDRLNYNYLKISCSYSCIGEGGHFISYL